MWVWGSTFTQDSGLGPSRVVWYVGFGKIHWIIQQMLSKAPHAATWHCWNGAYPGVALWETPALVLQVLIIALQERRPSVARSSHLSREFSVKCSDVQCLSWYIPARCRWRLPIEDLCGHPLLGHTSSCVGDCNISKKTQCSPFSASG